MLDVMVIIPWAIYVMDKAYVDFEALYRIHRNNAFFVTNLTEAGPLDGADLYRNRWQIETFFKWIKQNLTVKSFWGHSENAVKTHLWTAICTFLIVARIKASVKGCPYTITEVATLLGVSALSKTDSSELLTDQNNDLLNQNQDINEPTLF